jgi:hypothetical protein
MTQVLTRSPAIRHGDNTIDWSSRRPGAPGDGGVPAQPAPGDAVAGQPGSGETGVPVAPADGPTLADVIDRAWEVLGAELPAGCPVCGGELAPHAAGGRCESCGSTLT